MPLTLYLQHEDKVELLILLKISRDVLDLYRISKYPNQLKYRGTPSD